MEVGGGGGVAGIGCERGEECVRDVWCMEGGEEENG